MMYKKSILLVLIVLCTWVSAVAQTRKPEDIAGKMTEMMVRDLAITDSIQTARIYALHLKMSQLRQQQTEPTTPEQEHKRMQLFMSELKTILTAEQYNRFLALCSSHEPRHPHSSFCGPNCSHQCNH